MRKLLTLLVALVGLALMIIGIWGAQPIPGATNPRLLGGAILWIGGIMLLLVSPAVYCLARD
jgi:hypothetical protein